MTTHRVVTVTGRINTVHLRDGETAIVEWTERLQRLADLGYLTIADHKEGTS